MKKADIQRSYHRGSSGLPMVNVKVYDHYRQSHVDAVRAEDGIDDPAFTLEYVEAADANGHWLDAACSDGWEMLQADATDYFWPEYRGRVKVYSGGRCGGWAVVSGLPDVEAWDALMVNKWARFAKFARAEADDVFRSAVSLIWLNVRQPEIEAAEKAEADTVARIVGMSQWADVVGSSVGR